MLPLMCALHVDTESTPTLHDVHRLNERLTGYEKGTNESCEDIIARLISKLLHEWGSADNVVNMTFDTTASYTGHLTTAFVAIQCSLDRPLLWPACRHDIGEVLLTHVFAGLRIEASRSPEVGLFARLRDKWNPLLEDDHITTLTWR